MTNSPRRAFIAAMAVLALTGCSTGGTNSPAPSPSPSAATDADVTWSTVWSANQGVNLFSRGAELVRATVEAGYLAQARGDNRSFPGYATAIGPQQYKYGDPRRVAKNFGYAYEGGPPRVPSLTAVFYRLISVIETDTEVSGTVCGYGLSPQISDAAKYLDQSYAVTLHKPGGAPGGAAGVVDNGSNAMERSGKVPSWNVFAPWTITRIQYAQPDEVPASCPIWWKSVFPDAVKDAGTNQMTRPSGGPIAPDVAQFPKWISPSNAQ